MPIQDNPLTRQRGFALVAVLVAAYLAAIAYPFQWISNAAVVANGSARFDEPGALYWQDAKPSTTAELAEGVRIRLRLTPAKGAQFGAVILTAVGGDGATNLTLAQTDDDLVLWFRRSASHRLGNASFPILAAFQEGVSCSMEVEIVDSHLQVIVNGSEKLNVRLDEDPLVYMDSRIFLALGNNMARNRPWLGQITFAEIETSSGTHDLLSSPDLRRAGARELLRWKFQWMPDGLADALVNYLAMILIGILTAMGLNQQRPARSTLIWCCVCATGEILQIWLQGRHPSVSDFLFNVLGVWTGVLSVTRFRLVKRT